MRKRDYLLLVVLFLIVIISTNNKKSNYIKEDNIQVDTILQIKEKDSIVYNLVKQDSIIYLIRKEMKYEIEKSIDSTDSIVIEQFKELASE